eukprot:m.157302 g.157302  ORF g.157302 m.157302 type:complete len:546 (+) comp17580_c0_seq1:126-1763(+)
MAAASHRNGTSAGATPRRYPASNGSRFVGAPPPHQPALGRTPDRPSPLGPGYLERPAAHTSTPRPTHSHSSDRQIQDGTLSWPAAQDLARRLYFLDGFKKSEVCSHISKRSPQSQSVLEAYVEMFDFAGLKLVAAFRRFISKFALVGEADAQGRVLEAFAKRFQMQNAQQYVWSSEAMLRLVAAMFLLNTDLHSADVVRRMTLSRFRRNLEGVADGGNFPKDLLNSVYADIKQEALGWAHDDDPEVNSMNLSREHSAPSRAGRNFTDTPPHRVVSMKSRRPNDPLRLLNLGDPLKECVKRGCVTRKILTPAVGERRSSLSGRPWRRLYAMLLGSRLTFHALEDQPHTEAETTRKIFDLVLVRHGIALEALDYAKREHVFKLRLANGSTMLLQAESDQDMAEWISAINTQAALDSAPPLPMPVASAAAKFQRPTFPESRSTETVNEKVERYTKQLAQVESDLSEHFAEVPLGRHASLARNLQDSWQEKADFLECEKDKVSTYLAILTQMQVRSPSRALRPTQLPLGGPVLHLSGNASFASQQIAWV